MKTKFFLSILVLALSYTVQAQFPDFIKVDTGAVTQLWGGHVSSTCFDMDNDGDLEIASSNQAVYVSRVFSLFKNERHGYYVEMPEFTNIKLIASIGDLDNDGNIDLLVGPGYNFESVSSYFNSGNGNFQYGNIYNTPDAAYYPTLLDLNNDGFLDVVGISHWGSVLYNDGSGGFLDLVNLGSFQSENVTLHGVSWGDVDDDGDLDFFGGYSPSGGIPKNKCYINNGNGSFSPIDPSSPILEGQCTTTCANWVDYDNDGDMDLYVHNIICDNMLPALYENLGDMQFTRHDIVDEMYRYSLANSSVWGDLDNDGDIDLYISVENNLFPFPPPDTSATPFNILYLNDGNGQFTEFLDEQHPLVNEDTHTAMLFDHDNDGDLDVLMTRYSWSNNGHNNIFENQGNNNSWVVLTCEGTISNKSAIGNRVQAKAFVNGVHTTQTREITPINGHLSYANLRVHFGLGDADVIDTLIIRWPSGIVDTYFDVKSNRFYRAIEDQDLLFLCPQGNISFTSQEEIDDFPVDNPDCVEIAGNVVINGSNITNLNGLSQIEALGGNLEIFGNDSLTDFSGLNAVSGIAGDLKVHNNPVLSNFAGLGFLNSIGGSFQVSNNAALENMNSLAGFSPLASIGGNLWISGNPDLTSLSGLLGIDSIDGYIKIDSNNALASLSGLNNIDTSGVNSLYIRENHLLSTCHITNVCDYIEFLVGPVEIYGNATGCNSIEEVRDSCDINPFVEEIDYENMVIIYPNPCSGTAYLRYSISDIRYSKFELYSIQGIKVRTLLNEVQQPGDYDLEFDVGDLPGGLYFIRMQLGNSMSTAKLVVIP